MERLPRLQPSQLDALLHAAVEDGEEGIINWWDDFRSDLREQQRLNWVRDGAE